MIPERREEDEVEVSGYGQGQACQSSRGCILDRGQETPRNPGCREVGGALRAEAILSDVAYGMLGKWRLNADHSFLKLGCKGWKES